jgi:hypothetical protein
MQITSLGSLFTLFSNNSLAERPRYNKRSTNISSVQFFVIIFQN